MRGCVILLTPLLFLVSRTFTQVTNNNATFFTSTKRGREEQVRLSKRKGLRRLFGLFNSTKRKKPLNLVLGAFVSSEGRPAGFGLKVR